MRKLIILLLVLCGTFQQLRLEAQSSFDKFRFGIHLSPSLSWINTDDAQISGNGTALGIKMATQFEIFFAERYALETGIGFHFNQGGTLLSQYGGRFFVNSLPGGTPYTQGTPGTNVELDYSINYVEIPIGLKLRTQEFGYVTYYVEAPMFTLGIRSNSRGSISGGGVGAVNEFEDVPINEEVSPIALSWGFGAGAEYNISGGTSLFGGLSFQRLFTDVTRDKDYTYQGRVFSSDPRASINSLTLRLGVLF